MDDRIAAWLDYLASQRGLAPSTQREYRRDVRLLVAHLVDRDSRYFLPGVAQQHGPITDVGDITAEHLAALLVHLKREHQYSNATMARKIAAFKSFFGWARKTYLIATDPAEDLELPKPEQTIPQDLSGPQADQLLEQPDRSAWLGQRDYTILALALNTGARVSEIVDLDVDDLDFYRDQVRLHGKGSKERIVPLNRAAKHAAADWLDRREDYGPPADRALFIDRRHKSRMTTRSVQMLVSKHAQAAGLDGVTPHTLRHTFATRLLQRGANLREVQELLGHASPTTTATYTHIANRGLHDAVARLAETPVDWLDHIGAKP